MAATALESAHHDLGPLADRGFKLHLPSTIFVILHTGFF